MPRTTIDLEPYRAAIEQRLLIDHQSHAEVLAWLEKGGYYYSTEDIEASV